MKSDTSWASTMTMTHENQIEIFTGKKNVMQMILWTDQKQIGIQHGLLAATMTLNTITLR